MAMQHNGDVDDNAGQPVLNPLPYDEDGNADMFGEVVGAAQDAADDAQGEEDSFEFVPVAEEDYHENVRQESPVRLALEQPSRVLSHFTTSAFEAIDRRLIAAKSLLDNIGMKLLRHVVPGQPSYATVHFSSAKVYHKRGAAARRRALGEDADAIMAHAGKYLYALGGKDDAPKASELEEAVLYFSKLLDDYDKHADVIHRAVESQASAMEEMFSAGDHLGPMISNLFSEAFPAVSPGGATNDAPVVVLRPKPPAAAAAAAGWAGDEDFLGERREVTNTPQCYACMDHAQPGAEMLYFESCGPLAREKHSICTACFERNHGLSAETARQPLAWRFTCGQCRGEVALSLAKRYRVVSAVPEEDYSAMLRMLRDARGTIRELKRASFTAHPRKRSSAEAATTPGSPQPSTSTEMAAAAAEASGSAMPYDAPKRRKKEDSHKSSM